MSSIHPERPPQAAVQRSSVKNFQKVIQNLHKLVLSTRSPTGKIKVIQNATGGNVVLTSSSRRLIQSLSIRKPVIQLLISAAQGHLDVHKDGGLFLLSLSSGLVLRCLQSNINSKLLAEIFESFLTMIQDFISSDKCYIKCDALVSDINFMTCFVKSIIKPKLFCGLDEDNLDFISKLLLQVFLQSFSDQGFSSISDHVLVLSKEGFDVTESKCYNGIILEAPDLSKFKQSNPMPVNVFDLDKQKIKTALVTVSMSGDFDELSNVKYEVLDGVQVEDVSLVEIQIFCETLIQSDVGVVLCQKVIHPRLKLLLRQAGVVVIDRIGLQSVKYITKLTGASPIQCLDGLNAAQQYGWLDNVQHVILTKRSYLHLTRADNCVTTLLLYHQQEQQLEEVKHVCETSLLGLEKLLYQPTVLSGAGCWQALLVEYLKQKVQTEVDKLSNELECPTHYIMQACELFTQSLLIAALSCTRNYGRNTRTGHVHRHLGDKFTDCSTDFHHICQCGLYENVMEDCFEETLESSTSSLHGSLGWESDQLSRNRTMLQETLESRTVVLDGTGMCMSALQTGVLSACSLLKIGQVMENL